MRPAYGKNPSTKIHIADFRSQNETLHSNFSGSGYKKTLIVCPTSGQPTPICLVYMCVIVHRISPVHTMSGGSEMGTHIYKTVSAYTDTQNINFRLLTSTLVIKFMSVVCSDQFSTKLDLHCQLVPSPGLLPLHSLSASIVLSLLLPVLVPTKH